MEELIKIKEENGQQLVSARELHEFLEIGKKFTDWFKQMCTYGFEENKDYTLVSQKRETNNPKNPYTVYTDYAITIDMGKELAMIQRTERGKQARQYFIACEKKLKEISNKDTMLPQDYLSALKALVKSEEEKALMQPQVEYYQNVLNPSTYIKMVTITAIAKDLGMTAQKLNKKLSELKIIYKGKDKNWYLYADYQDKIPEYADYVINEHGQTLKFTEKGREWIINLISNSNSIECAVNE